MGQVFPDRKCSNPFCRTPERVLKPHEQFGAINAPICWSCHSDPPSDPISGTPLTEGATWPDSSKGPARLV